MLVQAPRSGAVNVWSGMSVVAYIAVTVAIFTLLGFVQKWVEQL